MKVTLYFSKKYLNLTPEQKKNICNGVGAKGAWYNKFIPGKKIFNESANGHDADYHFGKTQKDKNIADRRFNQNNTRIVEATKNYFLRKSRAVIARSMFIAVRDFGNDAYWKDKIVDEENSQKEVVEI